MQRLCSLGTVVSLPPITNLFVIVFLSSLIGGPICAQDSADSLSSLQQQWQQIDQQLSDAEEKLASGSDGMEQARVDYTNLVEEANETIEKIRSAAIEQIQSESEDKNPAIRALMGILLNEAEAGDDATVLKTGDFLIEQKVNPIWFETAAKSDRLSIESREIFDELLIRQRETQADDLPRVKLVTNKGDIVVELYENEAPDTVGNFISLVEAGQYSNVTFHRVIEGFMAQTGGFKPDGSGGKGPGYEIECECYTPATRPHFTGVLSMAHRGKDTGGSQFFITFDRTDFLDGKHTVFGRVIEGEKILESIQRTHVSINGQEQKIPDIKDDQIVSAEVIRKREHAYRPNKVGEDSSEETQTSSAAEEKPPASPDLNSPEEPSEIEETESSKETVDEAGTPDSEEVDDSDSSGEASASDTGNEETVDETESADE